MKHLYFIRHGESAANVLRQFAGQVDSLLTERGRRQAAATSPDVAKLGIDLILSSPLRRALDTAKIIAKDIGYPVDGIITNDLFMEHDVGQLAGKSWDDYREFDESFEGLESEADFRARVKRGLEFIKSRPEDTVLLVSHGGVYVQLLEILHIPNTEKPDRDANAGEPTNAKVTRII